MQIIINIIVLYEFILVINENPIPDYKYFWCDSEILIYLKEI